MIKQMSRNVRNPLDSSMGRFKARKIILTVVVEERDEQHHPDYKASYKIDGVFFKHAGDGRKQKAVQIASVGILKNMREIVTCFERDVTGALRFEDDV